MLAAQRQLYSAAKRLDTCVIIFSVWVPFSLSIFLLFFEKDTFLKNIYYVLAIVSMIVSYILSKYIEDKKKLAAFIQQQFDVYVYNMPWDERLFGKNKNVNHDIVKYSTKILQNEKEKSTLYNWYTQIVDNKNLNDGILSCQRENFSWDVGLRKRFKFVSIALILILSISIFAIGLWKNENLTELLCRIAFVVPMLQWILSTLKYINKDINTLVELDEGLNNNKTKTMENLQDIQKNIFNHRKECYAIPDYFYKMFKCNDEDKAHREASL